MFNILNGYVNVGVNCTVGENVVIDVAEFVTIGDRCVIPDDAYFGGRRVVVGNDFYGYSWDNRRLDIGRGRRDDEWALLNVGDRCTFHDNRIDLAMPVLVGDDVGLSPEVTVYTHGYWQSPFEGYPCEYKGVSVETGAVVGYRSVLLPGARVPAMSVVGAQSVVTGVLVATGSVFAGNPARWVRHVTRPSDSHKVSFFHDLVVAYRESRRYRGLPELPVRAAFPFLSLPGEWDIDVDRRTLRGEESPTTDDLRDFLFKRGIRIYTKRPFRKLPRS